MQLQPFTTEAHVDEALRLFQVSTLDAAMSGTLSGAEGFTSEEDHEMITRIEKQLKRRFAIGSQVSENSIIQDFTRQVTEFFAHNAFFMKYVVLCNKSTNHKHNHVNRLFVCR